MVGIDRSYLVLRTTTFDAAKSRVLIESPTAAAWEAVSTRGVVPPVTEVNGRLGARLIDEAGWRGGGSGASKLEGRSLLNRRAKAGRS